MATMSEYQPVRSELRGDLVKSEGGRWRRVWGAKWFQYDSKRIHANVRSSWSVTDPNLWTWDVSKAAVNFLKRHQPCTSSLLDWSKKVFRLATNRQRWHGRVYIQALGSNEAQHVPTSEDKLRGGFARASQQWTRNTEVIWNELLLGCCLLLHDLWPNFTPKRDKHWHFIKRRFTRFSATSTCHPRWK